MSDEPMWDCGPCAGTGKVTRTDASWVYEESCPVCGGSGKVPVSDWVRQTAKDQGVLTREEAMRVADVIEGLADRPTPPEEAESDD